MTGGAEWQPVGGWRAKQAPAAPRTACARGYGLTATPRSRVSTFAPLYPRWTVARLINCTLQDMHNLGVCRKPAGIVSSKK